MLAEGKVSHHLEHFWLCGDCAREFLVERRSDTEPGVPYSTEVVRGSTQTLPLLTSLLSIPPTRRYRHGSAQAIGGVYSRSR
jgi:hypothetical protein